MEPYIAFGYPNLKSVRELVLKRGYAKVSGNRLPLTDNKLVEEVGALGEWALWGVRLGMCVLNRGSRGEGGAWSRGWVGPPNHATPMARMHRLVLPACTD